jgi:hypothetical protein
MILFWREKLRSQLASEAGIEIIEMIFSTTWSYGRPGAFRSQDDSYDHLFRRKKDRQHRHAKLDMSDIRQTNLHASSSLISGSKGDRIGTSIVFDSNAGIRCSRQYLSISPKHPCSIVCVKIKGPPKGENMEFDGIR